jgi:hypothetical protein
MASTPSISSITRSEAARPRAGAAPRSRRGCVHVDHHQRDRLRQVEAEALGTFAQSGRVVLAGEMSARSSADTSRLLLASVRSCESSTTPMTLELRSKVRSEPLAQRLAPKQQHRAQHVVAADHRDRAAELAAAPRTPRPSGPPAGCSRSACASAALCSSCGA